MNLVILLLLLLLQVPIFSETSYPNSDILVAPEWLSQHLNDTDLRLVDIRGLSDYQKGHIPGAIHLNRNDI